MHQIKITNAPFLLQSSLLLLIPALLLLSLLAVSGLLSSCWIDGGGGRRQRQLGLGLVRVVLVRVGRRRWRRGRRQVRTGWRLDQMRGHGMGSVGRLPPPGPSLLVLGLVGWWGRGGEVEVLLAGCGRLQRGGHLRLRRPVVWTSYTYRAGNHHIFSPSTVDAFIENNCAVPFLGLPSVLFCCFHPALKVKQSCMITKEKVMLMGSRHPLLWEKMFKWTSAQQKIFRKSFRTFHL